jgi:hypothetical protein
MEEGLRMVVAWGIIYIIIILVGAMSAIFIVFMYNDGDRMEELSTYHGNTNWKTIEKEYRNKPGIRQVLSVDRAPNDEYVDRFPTKLVRRIPNSDFQFDTRYDDGVRKAKIRIGADHYFSLIDRLDEYEKKEAKIKELIDEYYNIKRFDTTRLGVVVKLLETMYVIAQIRRVYEPEWGRECPLDEDEDYPREDYVKQTIKIMCNAKYGLFGKTEGENKC